MSCACSRTSCKIGHTSVRATGSSPEQEERPHGFPSALYLGTKILALGYNCHWSYILAGIVYELSFLKMAFSHLCLGHAIGTSCSKSPPPSKECSVENPTSATSKVLSSSTILTAYLQIKQMLPQKWHTSPLLSHPKKTKAE